MQKDNIPRQQNICIIIYILYTINFKTFKASFSLQYNRLQWVMCCLVRKRLLFDVQLGMVLILVLTFADTQLSLLSQKHYYFALGLQWFGHKFKRSTQLKFSCWQLPDGSSSVTFIQGVRGSLTTWPRALRCLLRLSVNPITIAASLFSYVILHIAMKW